MKILALQNGIIDEINAATGPVPKWFSDGTCFVAFADGDPAQAAWHYTMATTTKPTPTEVGTSIARCVKFRLPKAITAANLRVFSIAVTALYRFAIYDAVTGNRLWESGTVTTVANDWNTLSLSNLALDANKDYWFCMTVSGTGTTSAFRTFYATSHANFYGAANSPIGALSIGMAIFAQFAVSSGNFPTTLPALAAAAYATADTGSLPLAFLTTF